MLDAGHQLLEACDDFRRHVPVRFLCKGGSPPIHQTGCPGGCFTGNIKYKKIKQENLNKKSKLIEL